MSAAVADRDLMELAAKAAGYLECKYFGFVDGIEWWQVFDGEKWFKWNPLADDGDSRRLTVALKMDVTFENGMVNALCVHPVSFILYGASELPGDDLAAATRRAVVLAAAEIGRAMP